MSNFDSEFQKEQFFPSDSFVIACSGPSFNFSLIAFSKAHANYIQQFVKDFLEKYQIHIRGDPYEATI